MPLVCKLIDQIQSSDQCAKYIGGIRVTYGIDWTEVDDNTVADGILTDLTIKTGSLKMTKIVYDDDNTASYNQDGAREGLVYRATQVAFMKFSGITSAKLVAANKTKGVLKGLYFHVMNSGVILVQGAELNAGGTKAVPSYVGAKVNPSPKTNTGEGANAIEYSIESVAADLLAVGITETELETMWSTPTAP